uniref:4a-hydroxytetrahydrobiopterin dehydratase n=1 Tax=Caenorhabditis japonica TaxID=281687 RepID=A0A8R1IXC9_CAEJA
MVDGRDAMQKVFLFKNFNEVWQHFKQKSVQNPLKSTFFQVDITLSTHDCGGLSENDVKLAKFIETAAKF